MAGGTEYVDEAKRIGEGLKAGATAVKANPTPYVNAWARGMCTMAVKYGKLKAEDMPKCKANWANANEDRVKAGVAKWDPASMGAKATAEIQKMDAGMLDTVFQNAGIIGGQLAPAATAVQVEIATHDPTWTPKSRSKAYGDLLGPNPKKAGATPSSKKKK